MPAIALGQLVAERVGRVQRGHRLLEDHGHAVATERIGLLRPEAQQAIETGNLPVVQGCVLFGAFFIINANLVVDIAYAFLDPRVRLQ